MDEQSLDRLGQALPSAPGAQAQSALAPGPIGVYAIDEQPLFRRGLAALLDADSAFRWLGEASSAAEALAVAHTVSPDVVLVDLQMPTLDGVASLQALRPLWPAARFVVMASQADPADLRRVQAAGASCMHKSASPQEVVSAIRTVRRGQRVLSPVVAAAIEAGAQAVPTHSELTPRERALLQLMAQGLDNRSIAQSLTISVPTVKFHITNILSKLQVANRTAAVLVALREKIIQLDGPVGSVGPVGPAAAGRSSG
jgi:NarL family two-component system response regulator LiaR